jgi:crotonyl-CoA carboxylase/reductase
VIAFCNRNGDSADYFIPGSDASGIVWKVGSDVKNVAVGDEVVIHGCRYDPDDPHIKAGKDPGFAPSLHMYGYESSYGGLGQYTRVQAHQCVKKPGHLSWAEAASYMVSGATAYRMLHGWTGNTVQENDPVLVWGGSGGLGCMAIQIVKAAGGRPVAVVSDPKKFDYCRNLGAVGVLNRSEFNHWGALPHWKEKESYKAWLDEAKRFGKAFWEALGEKRSPTIVFDHPGEDTIPTSIFMVEAGGMVVICAGTSGYHCTLDLRYHWVRQKRLQGSHFANDEQSAAITQLIAEKKVDPCLSLVFPYEEAARAHQMMTDNQHPPGNMAILVNATSREQRTLESE